MFFFSQHVNLGFAQSPSIIFIHTQGCIYPCGIAGFPQFEEKSRSFQKKVRDLSRTFIENPALFQIQCGIFIKKHRPKTLKST